MKSNNVDVASFKKIKQMYFFAIVTIAIAVIMSQLLVQYYITKQINDSKIINISGKQRMLSQKIVKEILILQSKPNDAVVKSHLKQAIYFWDQSQKLLQYGDKESKLSVNSRLIQKLFKDVEPYYALLSKESKNYLNVPNQKSLDLILKYESVFLSKMNEIVNQYEKEANSKVVQQRVIEIFLLVITLLILLLEYIVIFKRTDQKVEGLIFKLLNSEKKALQQAEDLKAIGEQKEDTVKELESLNYAMENTLLSCRITSDGTIIHIGEKFSKLLNYSYLMSGVSLPKVLSIVPEEQEYINNIIKNKQQIGWQGEVKLTDKNNNPYWLDFSLAPVKINKQKSELLVFCFDITKRKKAEQDFERVNQEFLAGQINQQKLISSKIVENLEKEQNRIAREIHDGIGQMLTGLKFSLESIDLKDQERSLQKIDYLKKLSLDIIKGIRTATFNLAPPELSDHGLFPALNKMAAELSKLTGKNIYFINKTNFNQRLDSLVEINVYRLVQEAVNNAIKYAQSSNVIIQLSHSANLLSITVDDDGVGFTSKKENSNFERTGMGFLFMKERVDYVNGRFFVNSIPGEGTKISFNIPI